jgi:hypothetical protein
MPIGLPSALNILPKPCGTLAERPAGVPEALEINSWLAKFVAGMWLSR